MKSRSAVAVKLTLVMICLAFISACSSVSFYSQGIIGHSRLMLARQSVDKVLTNADEPLASQLKLSKELKQFAVDQLGLPDSKSYNSYVDLKRDFPVWTVVAAEEFSITPKQWCYPVIGCAAYRGYFNQQRAIKYADGLSKKGLEITVGGAPAYSTLGWFADPLLPSMMRYGDVNFAETLFHELAHQLLYINGDSSFNEAFATVVGQEGVLRWLTAKKPEELANYRSQLQATAVFNDLLSRYKKQLEVLYIGELGDVDKRQEKSAVFSALEQEYKQIKQQQWGGRGWYDRWFLRPVNNARLAAFSTYYDRVADFEALLVDCDNDLPKFYQTLSAVKKAPERKDGLILVPQKCFVSCFTVKAPKIQLTVFIRTPDIICLSGFKCRLSRIDF